MDINLGNIPTIGGTLENSSSTSSPEGAHTPTQLGFGDPNEQAGADQLSGPSSLIEVLTTKTQQKLYGYSSSYIYPMGTTDWVSPQTALTIGSGSEVLQKKCQNVIETIFAHKGQLDCDPQIKFDQAVKAFYGAELNTTAQSFCRTASYTSLASYHAIMAGFPACMAKKMTAFKTKEAVVNTKNLDLKSLFVQKKDTITIRIPFKNPTATSFYTYLLNAPGEIIVRVEGKNSSPNEYKAQVAGCAGALETSQYQLTVDANRELKLSWKATSKAQQVVGGKKQETYISGSTSSTELLYSTLLSEYEFAKGKLSINSKYTVKSPNFDFIGQGDDPKDYEADSFTGLVDLTFEGDTLKSLGATKIYSKAKSSKGYLVAKGTTLGEFGWAGRFVPVANLQGGLKLSTMGWQSGLFSTNTEGYSTGSANQNKIETGIKYNYDSNQNIYANLVPDSVENFALDSFLGQAKGQLTKLQPVSEPLPTGLCGPQASDLIEVIALVPGTPEVEAAIKDCSGKLTAPIPMVCDNSSDIAAAEALIFESGPVTISHLTNEPAKGGMGGTPPIEATSTGSVD